jgi:6-pyruvoyltetrahydropterin/6-carboxytetrahydropterin synthase
MGWVQDFGDVKLVYQRVVDQWLDHRSLNDIPGLTNPTAENLCWFLFDALQPSLPKLSRVEVWETSTSMAALDDLEYETRMIDIELQDARP